MSDSGFMTVPLRCSRPRSDIWGQVIDIVGQIVDISPGGLMFFYIAGEDGSHESFKLDIVLAGHRFRLDHIPFKTVSDTDMTEPSAFTPMTMRQQRAQFGMLTDFQQAQLEYFIQNYAKSKAAFEQPASLDLLSGSRETV
jgi:hypothetical protein